MRPEDDQGELSDEQAAELERRWREHIDRPDSAIPWQEVRRRLIEREKEPRDHLKLRLRRREVAPRESRTRPFATPFPALRCDAAAATRRPAR